MAAKKGKLLRKREQAIAALIEKPTIREAAEKAGVSESTLFRWLAEEGFQEAYRKAKRQLVDSSITRLQKITGEAVEALREVMNDSESPPSSRVMAARTVLEMGIKAVELEDLEARVQALEKMMENRNGKN